MYSVTPWVFEQVDIVFPYDKQSSIFQQRLLFISFIDVKTYLFLNYLFITLGGVSDLISPRPPPCLFEQGMWNFIFYGEILEVFDDSGVCEPR